jgi:hypothetical protein
VFSRHLIEEALEQWEWGVLDKDKKKIDDHRAAIMFLKEHGLKGSGIIGAYHARRVAPLMACTLPLYQMAPDAPLEGTVLAEGALPNAKIVQRIKEVMEAVWDMAGVILNFVYPVLGNPVMRPDASFVEFISFSFFCPSPQLIF